MWGWHVTSSIQDRGFWWTFLLYSTWSVEPSSGDIFRSTHSRRMASALCSVGLSWGPFRVHSMTISQTQSLRFSKCFLFPLLRFSTFFKKKKRLKKDNVFTHLMIGFYKKFLSTLPLCPYSWSSDSPGSHYSQPGQACFSWLVTHYFGIVTVFLRDQVYDYDHFSGSDILFILSLLVSYPILELPA